MSLSPGGGGLILRLVPYIMTGINRVVCLGPSCRQTDNIINMKISSSMMVPVSILRVGLNALAAGSSLSSSSPRFPACVIACNYFRRNSECVCLSRLPSNAIKIEFPQPTHTLPLPFHNNPFCDEAFCMWQPLKSHYISQQLCSL